MRRFLALFCLIAAAAQAQDVRRISILHSNDLHARLLPDGEGRGGWAHLAALANRERAGCGHCVYVHAGDLVQGTPVSTLFKGLPPYEIANLFRFDMASLGNHEFDTGHAQIHKFVRKAKFPLIAANVVNEAGEPITGRGYVIQTVNGVRVAFLGGVMTNLVSDLLPPESAGPWKTRPIVETVRELSDKLRAEADLIVVVAHVFQREGSAILRQAPAVSVVIEGHTHEGRKDLEVVDNRLAAGCRGYGVELCRLDLEFDRERRKLVSWNWKRMPVIAAEIPPEPRMQRLIDKWERRVSAVVDVKIAETARDWTRPQLARLFARALREEMQADFTTFGSVRDEIRRGTVLARHIWNAIPFDNVMMVATVPGSMVPAALREGRAVDPDRTYRIALDAFVATNEASVARLGLAGIEFQRANRLAREVVIDWIRKKKTF